MKTIRGNAVSLFISDNESCAFAHGCNCFNTMGSGIAKEVRARLPSMAVLDSMTERGDRRKLGKFTSFVADMINGSKKIGLNLYTQYMFGQDKPNVDYRAIRDSIYSSIRWIQKEHPEVKKMYIPKIGAGLAGGNWETISEIIEESTPPGFEIIVVEYDASDDKYSNLIIPHDQV